VQFEIVVAASSNEAVIEPSLDEVSQSSQPMSQHQDRRFMPDFSPFQIMQRWPASDPGRLRPA